MEVFVFLLILILSVMAHEISHGLMADHLGDPTARLMGRLSLNPIKHIDLMGSIIVPGLLIIMQTPFLIGWAKPVPINPLNFRDQRYGEAKVSFAGPGANLVIALTFGLAIRITILVGASSTFAINLLGLFQIIVWINLLLAVFNLIPIPPLDGSHILFTFLPKGWEKVKIFMERYSLILLLFFILFLFKLIVPVVSFLFQLITGIPW